MYSVYVYYDSGDLIEVCQHDTLKAARKCAAERNTHPYIINAWAGAVR
jgi:hypothetical protein